MRRILVLASVAAVAMLGLSPLAQAQTTPQTPAVHSTAHKATTHKVAAKKTVKKKAPAHKVAAKKTVKKKPAVRTSAIAARGVQA